MERTDSINSYFIKEKISNKKLVNILNHKMFKGYRISKESKKVFVEKPKYVSDNCWERKTFDPFDDYYSIDYKNKNLSSLNHQDFSNLLLINNLSRKSQDEKGPVKKVSVHTQKGGNFRKKRIINLIKKPINKERYFYFCPDSQLITKNSSENKEKKDILYNTIFQDNNEKKLYNDIPIFAIDKLHKMSNDITSDSEKLKYIKNKEERQNDLQFLYKLSHNKQKKIEFKNRYNATTAKTNIIKSPLRQNKFNSFNVNSFKNGNKNKLNKNIHQNNNWVIVNNSFSINSIKKEFIKKYSLISKKRIFNEMGTQSKESKLIYSSSAGNLSIKKTKLFKIKKASNLKKKSNSYFYPIKQRIMSDKILKDQMDFKRWKFNKLRSMMET